MKQQKLLLAGIALSASLGFAGYNINSANAASGSVLVGGEELYVESGTKSNAAGTATYVAQDSSERGDTVLILDGYNGGSIKLDTGKMNTIEIKSDSTITGDDSVYKENDSNTKIALYSPNLIILSGEGGDLTINNNKEAGYCIKSDYGISVLVNLKTNCSAIALALAGGNAVISNGISIVDHSKTFAALDSMRIDSGTNITSSSVDFIYATNQITIGNANISATSSVTDFTNYQYGTMGIHATNGIEIRGGSTIHLDGYNFGLSSNDITIDSSNIAIKNALVGITTGDNQVNPIGNLNVDGGTLSVSASQQAVRAVNGSKIILGENVGLTDDSQLIGQLSSDNPDYVAGTYYTIYTGDCNAKTPVLETTIAEGATNKGDGELPCPVAEATEGATTIFAPDTGFADESGDNSRVVLESIVFGTSALIVLAYIARKYYKVSKNRQKVYWK